MFQSGKVPFLGDYTTAAAVRFVPEGSDWQPECLGERRVDELSRRTERAAHLPARVDRQPPRAWRRLGWPWQTPRGARIRRHRCRSRANRIPPHRGTRARARHQRSAPATRVCFPRGLPLRLSCSRPLRRNQRFSPTQPARTRFGGVTRLWCVTPCKPPVATRPSRWTSAARAAGCHGVVPEDHAGVPYGADDLPGVALPHRSSIARTVYVESPESQRAPSCRSTSARTGPGRSRNGLPERQRQRRAARRARRSQ